MASTGHQEEEGGSRDLAGVAGQHPRETQGACLGQHTPRRLPQPARPSIRPPVSGGASARPGQGCQGSLPGCWPFPNRMRGASSEHTTVLGHKLASHPPPPPGQRPGDGVGCTVHGETEAPPARPSCPAPAQPPCVVLAAMAHWAGAGAGVGQRRGRQALPHPGRRRGEVVGCVVSGQ